MINAIKNLFASTSPKKVIEAILRRKISYYDFDNLETDKKQVYYNEIQSVLRSNAFQNEVEHLMADWVQEIALSENEPNRDKMLRYSINGLKLLLERLEDVPDPTKQKPSEDFLDDTI